MKIRMFKQVIELGHYVPNYGIYWDTWVVDKIIEDAEEISRYIEEASKESTGFFGGVYRSDTLGNFSINYHFLGEGEEK